MAQIDSGLGWSCDEDYYVSSAGTLIETAGGTTAKATAGGCIAVAYKTIYNNYGLALISTKAANVGMTVTGDCAAYPAVGNDPDSADIGGITWYLRATDSVAGRSSLDYLSDYQYMGNYIVGSGTIAQEIQAILTAANVVYDSSVITDRYVKGYVEGVVKGNNERLKVGDVSSLTTTAKTSTVAAINEVNGKADSISAYLGLYNDSDIIGCKHDVVNYTHTRMANAQGKNAGSDFNVFPMYGWSHRCNLADNGTVNANYGDVGYTEDGSNGQCMVYRPKFYYRRVPLKLEPLSTGYGYLMREWIDYISYYPKPGFKLHPAFIGESRQEINGYYISTYEGSLYDVSADAYILDDAQVADFSADILCSIANAKPISGTSQQLTRANAEILAKNRGTGWHTLTLPILSAEQMLFSIEYATFNSQTAVGRGVVDDSAPIVTGQTSSLGNASGMASGTDGLVSVSYRGYENEWGNICKFVEGINILRDDTLGGGIPYICDDYNFVEQKNTDNYKSAGFTLASPIGGYISAFGYSEDYDWLYLPTETLGNSDNPISDWFETQAELWYKTIISGGSSTNSAIAGIYAMSTQIYDQTSSVISARLVYIPEK